MKNEKKRTPMMEQYFAIKEQHPDYLLFYRMGDFYEMFFDDAIKASAALDIALTKRGKEDGQDIPMCGVPVVTEDLYLARLIKKGFKVAVCEQMEDPAEAKKRGSQSCVRRDVVRLITSGTITEETILSSRDNNYLLCIATGAHYDFGLAWTDMSTGQFGTEAVSAEFLTAALARLAPKEIILCETLRGDRKFLASLNIEPENITFLPTPRYAYLSAKQNLQEFFKVETMEAFGDFTKPEITAAGVLLDYILLTQKGKMPRLERPVRVQDGQFMEIDISTRRSLELFAKMGGTKGATLMSVLDNTATGAGARLLGARLSSPLLDENIINRRLDRIDFFISHFAVREKVRALLCATGDIERIISRVSLGRSSPKDLDSLREVLKRIPKILAELYTSGDVVPEAIQEVIVRLGDHSSLADILTRALISAEDLPTFVKDGGFIKMGYSAEFDELKNLAENSKSLLRKLELQYIELSKIPNLKIHNNNLIGYFIEIPAKYAQDVIEASRRGELPFIHRQSMANTARFTTIELNELEAKITSAAGKVLALELELFADLSRIIMENSESILLSAKALAELDVATAMAILAEERNYCRPKVDSSKTFSIVKGRHPVVEVALQKGRDASFIANDCIMADSDEGSGGDGNNGNLWLITGPNMAGKSTFLRQNALIAIMAQAGLFVPADAAHIGVIDKLFSRVGASDDLAKGQSTFMVEMVETATILNRATSHSFVILDEIGRGTSTFDGLSIAWAVLEALHQDNKCRGLFATHYHELTALADTLNNLSLRTMKTKEWNDDIVFMYEIIAGKADRSYGIHVAKLAGLPSKVTARASEVLEGLETKKAKIQEMLGDLPLFAVAEEKRNTEDTMIGKISEREERLRALVLNINPDELTPREAIDEIYKLIAVAKND